MALFNIPPLNQLSQGLQSASSFLNNTFNDIQSTVSSVRNIPQRLQTLGEEWLAEGSNFGSGSGSALRLNLATQNNPGLQPGAEISTVGANTVTAEDVSGNISTTTDSVDDWRVSLSLPPSLRVGGLLQPLQDIGNRLVFPFTPSILYEAGANYNQIHPTHSNYPFNAYQNSQVSNITITGDFVNENQSDGKYYVAVLHYLKSMTKMFYGNGANLGNPPPVCRLNGYGKHVLNNIPVVITTFTTDFPADVDYIQIEFPDGPSFVPAFAQITVQVAPQYSRRIASQFNLTDFASGGFVGKRQGFN